MYLNTKPELLRAFCGHLAKPGDKTVVLFADGRAVEIRCFEFVVLINRVPVLAGKNAERVRHYSGAGITDQSRSQAVDNLRK